MRYVNGRNTNKIPKTCAYRKRYAKLAAKLLERKLHRQLHLTWIAHACTQEAAEVEQPRRD